MFKEVSADLEGEILAKEDKPTRTKRGPDFSIRTVTHWFTLTHKMGFCTVPTHYDNVPESDHTGQPYDKYPTRMCVEIGDYHVCRWCFIAKADVAAQEQGIPPTVRDDA